MSNDGVRGLHSAARPQLTIRSIGLVTLKVAEKEVLSARVHASFHDAREMRGPRSWGAAKLSQGLGLTGRLAERAL